MKKLSFLPLVLLGCSLFAVQKPVLETTFEKDSSGGLVDRAGGKSGVLYVRGKEITRVPTPFGSGLSLPGDPLSYPQFPASEKTKLADEFTFSVWFKVDSLPDAGDKKQTPYGLFSRSWDWRFLMLKDGTAESQMTAPGKKYFILRGGKVLPGEWNHLAASWSVSKGKYTLFLNGKAVAGQRENVRGFHACPVPAKSDIRFGSLWGCWALKGILGKGAVYGEGLEAEELDEAEDGATRLVFQDLRKRAAKIPGTERLLKRMDAELEAKVLKIEKCALYAKEIALAGKLAQLKASGLLTNDALYYACVDPMGWKQYLPDTVLLQEELNGSLLVAAARDEYEPASFVVHPIRDIPSFLPVLHDLKTKDGHVIKASSVDIRLVKVMVQPAGNRKIRTLKGSVLLHDDALVKVDYKKMENYLRLSFPGKTVYQWISKYEDSRRFHIPMKVSENPVYDAKTLQPLDLKQDFNRQFHLTFHITKDTAPGLYRSKIDLTSKGKVITSIPVRLRVLPFVLPEPRTNYDISRKYLTGVDYWAFDSAGDGEGTITSRGRNEAQFRAELRNMYAHGIRCVPNLIQLSTDHWQWNHWAKPEKGGKYVVPTPREVELTAKRIRILREEGFDMNTIIHYDGGGNFGYREFFDASKHRDDLIRMVRAAKEAMKKNGIEFFHQKAVDEATGKRLSGQEEIWKILNEMGIPCYADGLRTDVPKLAGKISWMCCSGVPDKRFSKVFHEKGGILTNYANPQAGRKERPYPYRVNYGFGCYTANYDGCSTYSYNTTANHPWNDFDNMVEGDINFIFQTADGVLDSPGWEGYREGFDDVRYATCLRYRILDARKGSDPAKKRLAERASKFLDGINVHAPNFDPSWIRMQIVEYILDLSK
ncbi:MAG: hypothetical protein J6A21_08930 [Lentisphaeria bacterium]|nr:hypothetical protein [Lentisphaeria bacterium]